MTRRLEAGALLLIGGQFAKAQRARREVLAKNDKNVRARVLLGNATAGLKDTDTAIKEFEEAIRLDPQQAGDLHGPGGAEGVGRRPRGGRAASSSRRSS